MYRAYYALPRSIKGSDGQPVNALLGTANAVLAVCEEHSPRAVVLCDGAEAATYRVNAFPDYHAKREPMPDRLAHQFAIGPQLWKALAWTQVDGGELEADDLMAAYAAKEERALGTTLIMTGDRDLLQCANDSTTILLTRPGSKGTAALRAKEVTELLGVRPEQVPDLIALRGDPSDGIPGAPGIGAKGAVDLLQRHTTLEQVIANAAGEKPRTAAALSENAELLQMFKSIGTVQLPRVRAVADRQTNFARGAKSAELLGMARLAARLREAA